ncbi:hypothetical protein R6Z07F_018264 [Ovis aries]
MHRNLSIKVIRTCDWGRAYCTVRADLGAGARGCAFGTGPGPPGAGEGASRPRWSPGSRRCGRPARRRSARKRVPASPDAPGPPRAAGRGPGRHPPPPPAGGAASVSRVPAGKFVRPPQQNKNVVRGGYGGGGGEHDSDGGAEAFVPGVDPPAPAVPGVCAGEGGVATGEEEGGARFRAPAPAPGRSPSVAPAPVSSPERDPG